MREVRIGETVAVQRISVTVRDGEWGTVPSVLKNLRVDAGRNRFALSFDASSRSHSVDFRWRGLLEGLPDGTISFSFEGEALRDFLKNRIGFCILHPATCAGLPCRFQTTDGTRGTGFLPRDVVPHQPFMDLRSFGHEVFPGTWARLDFQGDIFEMEDQRNWSDGSFKTYCTPLALPFPVQARAGMRIEQRITLSFEGTPIEQAPRTRVRRSVASIEAGPPTGGRLCRLGLGLGDDRLPQEWYREIMEGITPDHIRVECDLDLDDWEDSLGHKLAIVRGLDAPLWCLVATSAESVPGELPGIFERAGVAPRAVLVTRNVPPWDTPAGLARSCRAVFARAGMNPLIGGGTNAYFAELNRTRPPVGGLDMVFYSLTPQVHSADDRSLVENLAGQADAVRTAAGFAPGKEIAVSPVTLAPRFNPNLTDRHAYPQAARNANRVGDPRQQQPFGAAWAMASVAQLSRAGASAVTLFALAGPDGIGEARADGRLRAWPVREVFRMLARWQGAKVRSADAGPDLSALALEKEGESAVFLANLSGRPQTVSCGGARVRLRAGHVIEHPL